MIDLAEAFSQDRPTVINLWMYSLQVLGLPEGSIAIFNRASMI